MHRRKYGQSRLHHRLHQSALAWCCRCVFAVWQH
ncbi:Uncharacterised protein [Vibrio cholerae]|nr:Uncharacterised protein [Vibrio cholerae]